MAAMCMKLVLIFRMIVLSLAIFCNSKGVAISVPSFDFFIVACSLKLLLSP